MIEISKMVEVNRETTKLLYDSYIQKLKLGGLVSDLNNLYDSDYQIPQQNDFLISENKEQIYDISVAMDENIERLSNVFSVDAENLAKAYLRAKGDRNLAIGAVRNLNKQDEVLLVVAPEGMLNNGETNLQDDDVLVFGVVVQENGKNKFVNNLLFPTTESVSFVRQAYGQNGMPKVCVTNQEIAELFGKSNAKYTQNEVLSQVVNQAVLSEVLKKKLPDPPQPAQG